MPRRLDLQQALDALSSPVRREILWLTRNQETSAGAIAAHFELTAPTVSEHLALLVRAGLLTRRVQGTSRLYRARMDRLESLRPLLEDDDHRWEEAEGLPERQHARVNAASAAIVSVDVASDPDDVFDALTDGSRFSAWMGVPVTIDASGRFSCTMEWGTEIRGHYEIVVKPLLIAMRWDFADGDAPVPVGELTGYLRLHATVDGTNVTVHQFAPGPRQAEFLATAWSTVLGRLREGVSDGRDESQPRQPRAKR